MINTALSFIVPVYNVDKYVEKCILSLQDQDLDKDQFEIIIVDDASTDSSLSVCQKLESQFPNVSVYSMEKNSGVGAARNFGINKAKGEYLMLVDSDDYLDSNSIGKPLQIAKENHLDLLMFNHKRVDEHGNKTAKRDLGKAQYPDRIVNGKEMMRVFKSYFCVVWLFLLRREYYKSTKIQFEENRTFESVMWTPMVYYYAERIGFYNHEIYNYVRRKNSIITNLEREFVRKKIDDLFFAQEKLLDFKDTLPVDDREYFESLATLLEVFMCAYAYDLKLPHKRSKKLKKFKTFNFSFMEKILVILIKFNIFPIILPFIRKHVDK